FDPTDSSLIDQRDIDCGVVKERAVVSRNPTAALAVELDRASGNGEWRYFVEIMRVRCFRASDGRYTVTNHCRDFCAWRRSSVLLRKLRLFFLDVWIFSRRSLHCMFFLLFYADLVLGRAAHSRPLR